MAPLGYLVNNTEAKLEFRLGSNNEVSNFLSRYKAPEINCVNDDVDGKKYYLLK